MHRFRLLIPIALASIVSPLAAAPDDSMQVYKRQIEPLFKKYCVDCHGASEPMAGIRLDHLSSPEVIRKEGRSLEKVQDALAAHIMPPKEESQPARDEVARINDWIEKELSRCDGPSTPGRVTIRRLNRTEYTNTIRDLLGVDFQATAEFPADDVGYGFDNIGDVLTISPILAEKYLAAAERITGRALVVPDDTKAPTREYKPKELKGSSPADGDILYQGTNGEVSIEQWFNDDGQYVLIGVLSGTQAGDEPCKVNFRFDGNVIAQHEVPNLPESPEFYQARVEVKRGKHKFAIEFTNDFWNPNEPNPDNRDRNLVVRALKIRGPITPYPIRRVYATQLAGGKQYDKRFRSLISSGEVSLEHVFPRAGEYVVIARAYGDQGGAEPVKMEFRSGGQKISVADVKADKRGANNYQTKFTAKAGKQTVSTAFINDAYRAAKGNDKGIDRNLHVEWIEIQGPIDYHLDDFPKSHRDIMICQPTYDPQTQMSCARQIVERFATRAYRRPVTAAEVDPLLDFVDLALRQGESFERAIQLAMQAVLVSPRFLFRAEIDPANASAGSYRIGEYELASRLSYFLWSSMPDQQLFDLAAKGTLRTNLDAEVKRMLADPKSKALAENFGGQWLQTRILQKVTPDKKVFPNFDEPLRLAMKTETEMFFTAIAREDRSILDFLDADFTFMNERLARHYGIAGVKGDKFQRVALKPESHRGGVITQASILTLTSNPNRTSPVKRGKYLLEQILGTPPPPPPPMVPELGESKNAMESASLRARLEAHRSKAECASCHERMDPLGFALENFDAIGVWRTKDGKFPIDASGTLPSGKSFNGPADLKKTLKADPKKFSRSLSEKMLAYALGRGLEYYDRCAVRQIDDELAAHKYKFSSLILGIVHSDPFQMRASEGGRP